MIRDYVRNVLAAFMPTIPVTAGEMRSYVASTLTTVRWVLFAMVALLAVMAVAFVRASAKPPVVIRVDEIGNAEAISDYATNNAVMDVEVNAFAKDFVKSIVEVNSYTISKDLARALNMMTRQFQEAHRKKLAEGQYVMKIKNAKIQREMEIDRLAITARTPEGYELDVRGILSTSPLGDVNAPKDRGGLMGQLYIVNVPRAALTPYGLLVSNFNWREVPLEEVIKKDEVESLKE